MTFYWIMLLLIAFLAYTLGSLKSTVIASNFVFGRNLARLGKDNVWLSNFKRIYGIKGFIKLGLVEVIKDLLPLLIAGLLLGIKGHATVGRAFAGFCLVLGGLYPVFYGFRGGHASVYLVVAAFCVDISLGIAVGLFMAGTMWFTKYISFGTIVGAVMYAGVGVLVLDDRLTIILCALTALLVLFKHIPAMRRLVKHREQKFSLEEDISYKFDEKL